ncbi:uncharacterized protein B0H64DRAFT_98577 [Chaetomium fimeti]|uniref:Uncharacterized protein n=1 Tax=Chaetomium fimeti TaxID=1854472 RepID=A0AAE0HMN3_9PEZI|nr:hypothetical protein B0H64DRAFT_98577 [Chaetomium fimeti]
MGFFNCRTFGRLGSALPGWHFLKIPWLHGLFARKTCPPAKFTQSPSSPRQTQPLPPIGSYFCTSKESSNILVHVGTSRGCWAKRIRSIHQSPRRPVPPGSCTVYALWTGRTARSESMHVRRPLTSWDGVRPARGANDSSPLVRLSESPTPTKALSCTVLYCLDRVPNTQDHGTSTFRCIRSRWSQFLPVPRVPTRTCFTQFPSLLVWKSRSRGRSDAIGGFSASSLLASVSMRETSAKAVEKRGQTDGENRVALTSLSPDPFSRINGVLPLWSFRPGPTRVALLVANFHAVVHMYIVTYMYCPRPPERTRPEPALSARARSLPAVLDQVLVGTSAIPSLPTPPTWTALARTADPWPISYVMGKIAAGKVVTLAHPHGLLDGVCMSCLSEIGVERAQIWK